MKTKVWFCVFAVASLFLPLAPALGAMAAYPEKPVEIIVHSAPGGGSDLFARQVAMLLEKEGIVKQKINVANKYPPAEPEVLRLLAPQRGLTAIG